MRPPATDAPYTSKSIREMLGISHHMLRALVEAGFVTPARGPRNALQFTFRDAVLLRTACGLQKARIAPRRILLSLRRLRDALPAELPLTGLRITAVGNDVAVSQGAQHWAPASGQLLLDFEVSPRHGTLAFLPAERRPRDTGPPSEDAAAWFARGEEWEARDQAAAEDAYRRALTLAPDHADAYLNLGALLCEARRCDEAIALYDEALWHCPGYPLLHYNRAIALEDLGRVQDALASYETCLQLDAGLADAHYNAGVLHEQLGHARQALRHFSAYRRLQR